jgi:hypothetical protein
MNSVGYNNSSDPSYRALHAFLCAFQVLIPSVLTRAKNILGESCRKKYTPSVNLTIKQKEIFHYIITYL